MLRRVQPCQHPLHAASRCLRAHLSELEICHSSRVLAETQRYQQKFEPAVHGDLNCIRFEWLIAMANERKQLGEPMIFDPNARLRLAALDTGDALRKLGSKIRAAGADPQRQGEALQVAERVSRTYGDLLRMTLEDFN
jgi:hypothetical protein